MKIQLFCNKESWDLEKANYPFLVDGFRHIGNIADVKYSGIGWSDNCIDVDSWVIIQAKNNRHTVIDHDYEEDERFFKSYGGKKVLLFDEMHDRAWAKRKIKNVLPQYIICNYETDRDFFQKVFPNIKFEVIHHCAEKTLYRDYQMMKVTDLLLVGAVTHHYTFRQRLRSLMESGDLSRLIKCKILTRKDRRWCKLDVYAREINQSKMTIVTSSNYKYRLAKYAEVPMCASLMVGDVPHCSDHKVLRSFMCVIGPKMSDNEITQEIMRHYETESLRNEKIRSARAYTVANYDQESYAKRFVGTLEKWSHD